MKTSCKLLFLLFLLFSVIVFSASGQDIERAVHTYDNWNYITNETGVTMTGWLGAGKEVEIPNSIYGIPVTMLAESLFRNNTLVEKVYIPDSVTAIGRYAFQGCSSLREVRLPKLLQRIESYTFRYCTSLEKIELPENLTNIQSYSFNGCLQLKEITIPDSVTSMSDLAFGDCSSLENVSISKNLTYIGADCFQNTPWLEKQTEEEFVLIGNVILYRWNGSGSYVEIPYGVTMIADAFTDKVDVETVVIPATVRRLGINSFRNAVNLKTINIPDTVTRIDNYAFRDCRSLRTISLPDSITVMGRGVFQSCEKLTEFEIPWKVSTIEPYFLADCAKLSSVIIPSAVTMIDPTAFEGSPLIQLRVTYDSAGEHFAQENLLSYTYYLQQTKDFIYSRNEEGIQILKYIGNLFEVEIPVELDGLPVNRINTAAFQNNPVPKKIIIPDSVQTIGDWAFSYMDSLVEIKMSKSLTVLGADAFTGSENLKSVSLPDSLEEIGVEPFEGLNNTLICAGINTRTSEILQNMGYDIQVPGVCSGEVPAVIFQTDENSGDAAGLSGISENNDDVNSPEPENFGITESPTELPASIDNSKAEVDTFKAVIPSEEDTPASTKTPIPAATDTIIPTKTPVPSATNTMIPTSTTLPAKPYTPAVTQTSAIDQTPTATKTPLPRYFVYIPGDVEVLTPEYLDNTAYVLTVIVPSSVKEIDERIMNGHQLTIVSSSGTAAEEFARTWGLKFLMEDWFDPSQIPMEDVK